MNYKADITLNEKDSLVDMLNTEKALVKLYATAITEGCSNGYRTVVKKALNEQIQDQVNVFFCLTENNYERVVASDVEDLEKIRKKFSASKNELS